MPGLTVTRRALLYGTAASVSGLPSLADAAGSPRHVPAPRVPADPPVVDVTLTVDGEPLLVTVETCVNLLDMRRETVALAGAMTGCDNGSCAPCTAHACGTRVVSCLTLTARCDRREITVGGSLSP